MKTFIHVLKGTDKVVWTTIVNDAEIASVLQGKAVEGTARELTRADQIDACEFFDAIEHVSGSEYRTNLDKAKEVWRKRIRAAREPKLKLLDIKYFEALEKGDSTEKEEIIAKKKALRDITSSPLLGDAKSVQEIMAFWPTELN